MKKISNPPFLKFFLFLTAIFLISPISQAQGKAIEGVVNINTAGPAQLTLLPGIGQAKARQILELRAQKIFSSLEDLKAIKGLGPKRLEALKSHVVFSGETTAKRLNIKARAKDTSVSPQTPATVPPPSFSTKSQN